jgi:hypothetical protein
VLANTFVDIVGNTNTAITKNTTKISDVPFEILISSTLNDPFLMASLKLKVIVLEAVFFPPLPVIVKVGVVDMIYFPIIGFYKSIF